MGDALNRSKILIELRKIQMSPDFQRGRIGESRRDMDLYLERLMLMQKIYDTVLTMKSEADTSEVNLDDAV